MDADKIPALPDTHLLAYREYLEATRIKALNDIHGPRGNEARWAIYAIDSELDVIDAELSYRRI